MRRDNPIIQYGRGLSFIEIVTVMAIVSLVSLAVYASLSNGIAIWQRINKPAPEEDLNIFLGRFSQDLKNTLKFAGLEFVGLEDSFEVPTLVSSPELERKSIGKVIYYYDRGHRVLKRQQQDFSRIYNRQEAVLTHQLERIDSLHLLYYGYDDEKKEFLWREEWKEKGKLPLAVRMVLHFNNGIRTKEFTKTVDIPISG